MTTVFKTTNGKISYYIENIEHGKLALPDIQRPFVWKPKKVRDLFDSLFKGYPVGSLMIWVNPFDYNFERRINIDAQNAGDFHSLIIDGQQRLTSLYAVFTGKPVLNDKLEKKVIKIAFNPLTAEFEVARVGTDNSAEWISNISDLFKSDSSIEYFYSFLENLNTHREHPIGRDEKKQIMMNIEKLFNLKSFEFQAIEIDGQTDPEIVANIFERINSKGVTLNQADFISTLMSVIWHEGRDQIMDFCQRNKIKGDDYYNGLIEPDPSDILRVNVGLGFNRARLQYGYLILQGKNLQTKETSKEEQIKQFDVFKKAQACVLDLQNWKDFLQILMLSGIRNNKMITSKISVFYAYSLYLIGKYNFNATEKTLQNIISRWYFMSILTARYINSPETKMEQDLNLLRDSKNQDEVSFLAILNNLIDIELNDSFWGINLPENALVTSSGNSPYWNAYTAALNILDVKVLFSEKKVADLLSPTMQGKKNAVEKHHLFPKNYLKSKKYSQSKYNQVANFAYVEWRDNIKISDKSPKDYLAENLHFYKNENERKKAYHYHALPEGWENMGYHDFLQERRKLIAKVIKEGFDTLA